MAKHVLPPAGNPAGKADADPSEIVSSLEGYRMEAVDARKGGPNPRDAKWEENLDLYWNRFDFSRKADWQARETMPEVPSFVDRFAAALKEALVSVPEGFYTVLDPTDTEGDLAWAIKRMTDVWLSRSGRNANGQLVGFPGVFEEQAKLGALMACCSVTMWKDDVPHGRVAVESVDPRTVWLDHTGRRLYRVRRIELDRHDLQSMLRQKDSGGRSIFKLEEIEGLVGHMSEELRIEREKLTGTGGEVKSTRVPVFLDEYVATILDHEGKPIAEEALAVVANEKFLIRGPEKNPFWHGRDWLLFAPLITVPLSVYGRSYMEDFGSVAKTFNKLTNLILDATQTSALNAFALVPSMLINPEQAAEGVGPNKLFLLEEGFRAEDFMKSVDTGRLAPEAVQVWNAIKNELREAAGINEIGLGQFAPKGRTSATEIRETQQSSSALIRSVAQTTETLYLEPQIDLVWKTGLQHVSARDPAIADAVGRPMFEALHRHRRELIKRPITFQARGISTLLARSRKLRALMGVLQFVAQNELLLREFLRAVSMERLVEVLFELSDIDMRKLQATDRDRLVRSITEPLEAAGQRAEAATRGQTASEGAQGQMGQVARLAEGL